MKKKVLAMVMAAAMTFGTVGMSTVVFAAEVKDIITTEPTDPAELPKNTDKGDVEVINVESGRTVTAYQIVEANYRPEGGFTGYKAVSALAEKDLTIENPMKPSSFEVADIVAKMNASENSLNLGTGETLNWNNDSKTYTGSLKAGYWIVIVSGGTSESLKVYNPMLVGVWYSVDGSTNTMASQILDPSKDWSLESNPAYAKYSDINFAKTANVQTADWGDPVEFDVTAQIPEYSGAYGDVDFIIRDTMANLTLSESSIEVSYLTGLNDNPDTPENEAKEQIPTNMYEIKDEPSAGYDLEIVFNPGWIKEHKGKTILVEYTATTTEGAINAIPHKNTAELEYTNDPSGDTLTKTDDEKVYTFDIDGKTTAGILKKVAPGEKENEPLKDAEFTLYTNSRCTEEFKYTNSYHEKDVCTAKSDADGKLLIQGLAEGTYYLKETKAPKGYTLNDTIYEIKIAPVIDSATDVLSKWSITVTDTTNNSGKTNTFVVGEPNEQGVPTVTVNSDGDGKVATTEIQNTTISTLPSTGGIGTTIFTIGGCAIMIAAAGIFFVSRKKEEEV